MIMMITSQNSSQYIHILQYFTMSQFDSYIPNSIHKNTPTHQARQDRLKQIQALYRQQIKEIYHQTKIKIQNMQHTPTFMQAQFKNHNNSSSTQIVYNYTSHHQKNISTVKSMSSLNNAASRSESKCNLFDLDEQSRPSTLLRVESSETFQTLRIQNQTKQLKIRQLTNKIQSLVQKLKKYMKPQQFQQQMQKLKQFADTKMQRLENLFKIKDQEIFFKIKLQITNLLHQFGVAKQELAEVQDIVNQSTLITFMTKKLKGRLKDLKCKQQDSYFSIKQDKIRQEKQQQRIHYLTETNELLRLSESKLKNKIEDLKAQLNDFLKLLKERQAENEQRQSQVFKLKKQLQELNSKNEKLLFSIRQAEFQRLDEQRAYQTKINEMKLLLNNYFNDKNKLSLQLEQKQGQIEELIIKLKFLQQQNERINRELMRWKERYDWSEKEKDSRYKDLQQKNQDLRTVLQKYKQQHNDGIILYHKTQTEQALRKAADYQKAYEELLDKIQDQKNLLSRFEQINQQKILEIEEKWMQRMQQLQQLKDQQLSEINQQKQIQLTQLRQQFFHKQALLMQQMEARIMTLHAQKDKNTTQRLVELGSENDQLHKQIQNLNKVLSVKEALINVISNKKVSYS